MKKTFAGYYAPTESEFAELWAKARIIVDANVLLATYGVSPSTREELLRLLERVKTRLWIPHQFALEYQRNRLEKILEQVKHYDDAHKTLRAVLDGQLRSRTRHPFVSQQLEIGLEDICAKLLEGKEEQEKLLTSDLTFERTTELFDGRVGAHYSDRELNDIYEAARKRFSEKIPPGYEDRQKPEPARFGDYVGWRQILDFAMKNNASVILVTDDDKEDWWRKERGKNFGPRPELVVEFRDSCSALFYMYASDRFLELSEKYFGGAVDQKAIDELKERRESEPHTETLKPADMGIPDVSTAKPAGYSSQEQSDDKATLSAPKSTNQEIEKPEGK